jgi:hypothetical protein
MLYALSKALRRLLLLEAAHAVFLCFFTYFVLHDNALPDFLADLVRLYVACKLMHVVYVVAVLEKLSLKSRIALSLPALIAALCPFLMFRMSDQYYSGFSLVDNLDTMHSIPYYGWSWSLAVLVLFFGLCVAIDAEGERRESPEH